MEKNIRQRIRQRVRQNGGHVNVHDIMRRRKFNDIVVKNADGTVTIEDNEIIGEDKFSLSSVTDKMGVTNAGSIAKGFIWGIIIGAAVVVGIGLFKNKINISSSK